MQSVATTGDTVRGAFEPPVTYLYLDTREVAFASDVELDAVAATTPGMAGADRRNRVNETALLAARRGCSARYLRGRITGALGGRAAEAALFGELDAATGISQEAAAAPVEVASGRAS